MWTIAVNFAAKHTKIAKKDGFQSKIDENPDINIQKGKFLRRDINCLSFLRGLFMKKLIIFVSVFFLLSVSLVMAGGRPLSATLTGAAEVPGPGDPDGAGTAHVTLNQGRGEVCFDIEVSDINPVLAAHIHKAPVDASGGVVVNFNISGNGLSGCVGGVDKDLIKDIRQNPEQYYVNVHNNPHFGGALRGQLSK